LFGVYGFVATALVLALCEFLFRDDK